MSEYGDYEIKKKLKKLRNRIIIVFIILSVSIYMTISIYYTLQQRKKTLGKIEAHYQDENGTLMKGFGEANKETKRKIRNTKLLFFMFIVVNFIGIVLLTHYNSQYNRFKRMY